MSQQDIFVIYLHGFRSSPLSRKAQQTLRYCSGIGLDHRLLIPELEDGPKQTFLQVQRIIRELGDVQIRLIGSSLGGYYATCLAETFQLKAVLVNPAVRPYERWQDFIGEHKNYYSHRVHHVTRQHGQELKEMDREHLEFPDNYLLLANKGDEILDYRQAEARYSESTSIIQEGGDHSFENYAEFLPVIFDFLAIKN